MCSSDLAIGAPIAGVDDVRVRIDKAGNDSAPARVDARRAFVHFHRVGEPERIADVRDTPFEGGDDAVGERRDFALREPATRSRPGAGGDQVSVFDQEVRREHADLA